MTTARRWRAAQEIDALKLTVATLARRVAVLERARPEPADDARHVPAATAAARLGVDARTGAG